MNWIVQIWRPTGWVDVASCEHRTEAEQQATACRADELLWDSDEQRRVRIVPTHAGELVDA